MVQYVSGISEDCDVESSLMSDWWWCRGKGISFMCLCNVSSEDFTGNVSNGYDGMIESCDGEHNGL